jgi:heavy metal efflux system protein
MEMRMDETITGTRGDVALKIFGNDLDTLERLAGQAEHIISAVPGATGTQMEHDSGAEELQLRVDRAAAAARYGVNVSEIQEMIESLYGGKQITEMIEGEERFPITIELPVELRNNLDYLQVLQVRTSTGELIRLDRVVNITTVRGPVIINREEAHRAR